MNAEELGLAVVELGGGRRVATDSIDFSVGFEMLVRIGDHVDVGTPLLNVFADDVKFERVKSLIEAAIAIGSDKVQSPPLIKRLV